MIRKTQRIFNRRVKSWPNDAFPIHTHTERVLRETWWLLWTLPLYSRDTIQETYL